MRLLVGSEWAGSRGRSLSRCAVRLSADGCRSWHRTDRSEASVAEPGEPSLDLQTRRAAATWTASSIRASWSPHGLPRSQGLRDPRWRTSVAMRDQARPRSPGPLTAWADGSRQMPSWPPGSGGPFELVRRCSARKRMTSSSPPAVNAETRSVIASRAVRKQHRRLEAAGTQGLARSALRLRSRRRSRRGTPARRPLPSIRS
jgi:hypothetical protein